MKKLLMAVLVAAFAVSVFARIDTGKENKFKAEKEKAEKEGFISGTDEDLDSLFDDAEDISMEDATEIETPPDNSSKLNILDPVNSIIKPLYFFGNLDTELGSYFRHYRGTTSDDVERNNALSWYFKFKNDLGFKARPSQYFAITGLTRVEIPENMVANSPQINFALRELYFDYNPIAWLYITAGKKNISWGYVRMFNNEDDFKDVNSRLTTNIVADSVNGLTAVVSVPTRYVSFTGLALYNGNSAEPDANDISYAGSIEGTFLKTSLNLFARRTAPNVMSKDGYNGIGNVVGAEIKRTCFTVDLYGQASMNLSEGNDAREEYGFFEKRILTFGVARVWDYFAFNVEFQDIFNYKDNDNIWKLAVDLGVKRLGKYKDWKIGIQWRHDVTYALNVPAYKTLTGVTISNYDRDSDKESNYCYVKVGVIKSGILPHADLKLGGEMYYNPSRKENVIYKWLLGATLHLVIDY